MTTQKACLGQTPTKHGLGGADCVQDLELVGRLHFQRLVITDRVNPFA